MGKEEIFSKLNIKDYSKEFERILDKKDFSEDVKNLLLDILYKIDIAYSDYNKVKNETLSKREIVEELLDIIKNDCNKIELLRPKIDRDINDRKYKINREKNRIAVFPNANILMFALYEMSHKKYRINKSYEIVNKPLEKMLNNGWQNAKCEIIRDFDGWTWNIEKDQIDDMTSNLIYQGLNMLLGENFLEINILSRRDIMKTMENNLKFKYDEEIAKRIILLVCKICVLKELLNDTNKINSIIRTRKLMQDEVRKMENKKEYLQNLAESKKVIGRRIRQIDETLSNNKSLKREFLKYNEKLNEKNKIFSVSDFVEKLQNERKELINEYEVNSNLMKPSNYVRGKEDLKEKIEILKDIKKEGYDIKKDLRTKIIMLQKLFLKAVNIRITRARTKKEIIDLIYKIRYYKLLPLGKKKIMDIKDLQEDLIETETLLYTRGCKLKVLPLLSGIVTENYRLMSNILESKIIDLEKISILFKKIKTDNKIVLNIYDDNVIDNTIEYNDIIDLNVRLNRKIKLFIK